MMDIFWKIINVCLVIKIVKLVKKLKIIAQDAMKKHFYMKINV
jgi:hypothetical protein